MMHKYKQYSGFTLIELIIVVVIVGILASMAIPAFNNTIERIRIKNAAEAVLSDLRWARSEAIKRNTSVTVTFTSGAAAAWSYVIAPVTKTVNSNSIKDFANVALSQNFTGNILTFNQVRGTASAGTVSLTSSNYELDVVVSLLGRVRICGNTGGYDAC